MLKLYKDMTAEEKAAEDEQFYYYQRLQKEFAEEDMEEYDHMPIEQRDYFKYADC
jgi:hypothetical protein